MAIKIPEDFDARKQNLDGCEADIRDTLGLHITNWCKFRHAIRVGTDSSALLPISGSVRDEVRDAYLALGKSHYEVVTSLGCAKLCTVGAQVPHTMLMFRQASKSFYFHVGCLIDNLARLIFIINDPRAESHTYKNGYRRGLFMRDWIDWGELRKETKSQNGPHYEGYARFHRSRHLRAIINIRNGFAHAWSPPVRVHRETGVHYWPVAMRTERNFHWPHDKYEHKKMNRSYRKYVPIWQMIGEDFKFVESFQDQVFARLVHDITKFETRNAVRIE